MKFNRKTQLDSEIPTASMPDIIFMLLILLSFAVAVIRWRTLPPMTMGERRSRCVRTTSNPRRQLSEEGACLSEW